jgi:ABC-2 type transport system ATP-binding protein
MSAIPSEYVIETRALSKRYGRKLALDHLDLQIPRGRIHAIVGANGAGKSTLFRILLGFLAPSTGSSRILGRDSQQLTPQDRGRIGFVNEEHTLPGWIRVDQVSAMQRHQYPRWNQDAYDEVIGHYHVLPEQKVGQLSRGERAGCNLALALAQSPDLLVLDEPTLGLDVVAKRAFLESLMYGNAAADCTVIYCSHQMEEIERVADNLIILERGQLKHMSAPEDFTARVTLWVADVPFKGPDPGTVPGLLEMQRLDGLHHYLVLDQDEGFAQFLRAAGARSIQSMPVSLDRAVNGFLAKNHAAPMASAGMSSAGMPSTGASPTRTPSRDTSR